MGACALPRLRPQASARLSLALRLLRAWPASLEQATTTGPGAWTRLALLQQSLARESRPMSHLYAQRQACYKAACSVPTSDKRPIETHDAHETRDTSHEHERPRGLLLSSPPCGSGSVSGTQAVAHHHHRTIPHLCPCATPRTCQFRGSILRLLSSQLAHRTILLHHSCPSSALDSTAHLPLPCWSCLCVLLRLPPVFVHRPLIASCHSLAAKAASPRSRPNFEP